MSTQNISTVTVNQQEIAKFSAMADEWWDPHGKFRPLHKFNPTRLDYIKTIVCAQFNRNASENTPFKGLRFLDIGCGGGLLSEPMCRLGAEMVGADAGEANIKTAAVHAEKMGLAIDYRCTTADALAADGETFDVILNMEVVEHVADVPAFMNACAEMVRPGGVMFFATLNRTFKSFALAIVGAEYVLRWLPRGTHDWNRFITPDEMTEYLEISGLTPTEMTGVSFNPLSDSWRLTSDLGVNYMGHACKATADG
ncbi:MAG: bifunctional 2-polyprenyl-6-hydroxyphenol methylase/3-demethylubiquinol 3-O-methyltransferase UbiG [Parvibaculales bacterium]